MLKDTYRHIGMRRKLITKIAALGIEDEQILDALLQVPRHFFFEKAFVEKAYENQAFPIGEGQTISQPYTVAYQTALLNIKAGDKVLEVGTGSGYQACILVEMGAKVVTIERNQRLYQQTKALLETIGYPTITTLFGDGYEGAITYAPFDKIIVTAAAPYIPPVLLDQLKIDGILVIPVGEKRQTMYQITKASSQKFIKEDKGAFRFVPLLKGTS